MYPETRVEVTLSLDGTLQVNVVPERDERNSKGREDVQAPEPAPLSPPKPPPKKDD